MPPPGGAGPSRRCRLTYSRPAATPKRSKVWERALEELLRLEAQALTKLRTWDNRPRVVPEGAPESETPYVEIQTVLEL